MELRGIIEYDLIVAPGADPTQIRVAFDGADRLAVDEQGDLVLTLPSPATETGTGTAPTLRVQKPVVYQQDEQGAKHLLAGNYVLLEAEPAATHSASLVVQSRTTPQVAFQVAAYDQSRPLIIDPVLSWATYLGGGGFDNGQGIAVDAAGNAYVTGFTSSPNFPGTAGSAIQSMLNGDILGNGDTFVTKLNAAGTALVYSTYLGGSGGEAGDGIAVDAAGNAYVTGSTTSPDFPGVAGSAIQSTLGGGDDAFVTKLNATGTAIVYSTYLGGSRSDQGGGIAVDASGNVSMTGSTNSLDFPGTAGSAIQSTFGGFFDAFVTKLNAAGTALVYSTYLGGSDLEAGARIAVDAVGNAYVTGRTRSSNFPGTANSAIQSTLGGGIDDAFVTKLNAAGTVLVYSNYLGGFNSDGGSGIAVDAAGNAYVAGTTRSPNFPGTPGSTIQRTLSGFVDAFVTKLNAAGTAVVYSTYLGGSGIESDAGIAVDAVGNASVTGLTSSTDFPGTAGSATQSTNGGGGDVFITKLNAPGTALVYSTYLGGSGLDEVHGIAMDAGGNTYVMGRTSSSDFPGTASSTIQRTFGGGENDVFVAKITEGSSSIPFAAFGPKAEIHVLDRAFELKATFTLGSGNNGIAPLTEPVVVQVGTFTTTIPAGSFKQYKGRFVFEGTINGVRLEAVLRSLILGNDYGLTLEGHGVDVTGVTNPVTVSLTIGNDSGSQSITAEVK